MELEHVSVSTKRLLDLEQQYSAGGYDPLPAFMDRAQGVKLWVLYSLLGVGGIIWRLIIAKDVDGKEYLDFVCMFGAVNQGHSHPGIVEAVIEQMKQGYTPFKIP